MTARRPTDLRLRQYAMGQMPLAAARAGLRPRRWLAPSLRAAQVRAGRTDGWRAFLIRAPAGTALPSHRHAGEELIAVLTGAFVDGERADAGDFVEAGPAVHRMIH